MCESSSPGMTLRSPASMTRVRPPRSRNTSSSDPTAMNFSPLDAKARAEGRASSSVVTIAFRTMKSAGSFGSWPAARDNAHPDSTRIARPMANEQLLMRSSEPRSLLPWFPDDVLSLAVALRDSAVVRNELGVEGAPLRRIRAVPGAMGLAENGVRGHRNDAGVRHPEERDVGCHPANVARGIHDRVHLVAIGLRLERGEGDANTGPYARHDEGLPARRLDGLHEVGVVPCAHLALATDVPGVRGGRRQFFHDRAVGAAGLRGGVDD